MGVHTGEASESGTGLVGYQVHRAARIAALAHGGQVLLSASTAELVMDSLPEDVALRDLGRHQLKDLGRPETLYQLVAADLPADFPKLRSLYPELPNNLPVLASSFIGRDVELREVADLVSTARVTTLTGAGGVGKTRLSLQVAAGLLKGIADGVWLVELAGLNDAEAVPNAVARSLGIKGDPGRSVTDTLVDVLAEQNVLLLLDNCEHLLGICAELTDRLVRGCPGVRVLVTSREPLGIDGERVYRVLPMSLPSTGEVAQSALFASDAVRLFAARAPIDAMALVLDEESTPLVVDICRRLDGMPLALELAAARLQSMSLGTLHDRLGERSHLLEGGPRTALPRQRSLWATIAWSYELLEAAEKAVLRRLSVFAGSFALAAAEAVCASDEVASTDVASLLFSLVAKSLVQVELTGSTDRYRLLETVRDFASDRLAQEAPTAGETARSRHASWFFELARSARKEWTELSRERLDVDDDNLRSAFDHLVNHDDDDCRALRMAINLSSVRMERGEIDDGIAQLRMTLEQAGDRTPPELRVKAARELGILLGAQGEIVESRRCLDEGLTLARTLEDRECTIGLLNNLSFICAKMGEASSAISYSQEAVQLALATGDDSLIAWSLLERGSALEQSDSAAARADLEAALRRYERLNSEGDIARTLTFMGSNDLFEGNFELAKTHFERALSTLAQSRDQFALSWILQNLGLVAVLLGDTSAAIAYSSEALSMLGPSGSREVTSCVVATFALCSTKRGAFTVAARLHGAAGSLPGPDRFVWEPFERQVLDEDVAQLRAVMGTEAFDVAYAEGAALSREAVIQLTGTVAPEG
jgi:predicted ATPase